MGKAIVYAVMGLITLGLVLVAGLTVKSLIILFLGRKKKREQVRQILPHSQFCSCSQCGPDPERMHKYDRP